MKNIRVIIIALACILSSSFAYTQTNNTEGVSIAPTVTPPDESAMLDVSSTDKGMLIPRVSLSDVTLPTPIVSTPAEGLLVYNTNVTVTGGSGKGFYYWDSSKWVKMGTLGMSAPQITYNQMINMLTGLTMADRGMMVFVTDVTSPYARLAPCGDCNSTHHVLGMWFLSSMDCGNGIQLLEWQRITYDRGTNQGSPCQLPSECCPGQ